MDCLRCQSENLRDYPVCSTCEPHCHFQHRADCRCLVNADCEARRMQAGQLTETDHHRAVIGGGLVLNRLMGLIEPGQNQPPLFS